MVTPTKELEAGRKNFMRDRKVELRRAKTKQEVLDIFNGWSISGGASLRQKKWVNSMPVTQRKSGHIMRTIEFTRFGKPQRRTIDVGTGRFVSAGKKRGSRK